MNILLYLLRNRKVTFMSAKQNLQMKQLHETPATSSLDNYDALNVQADTFLTC